ncbi:hypothetical protein [Thomasclavelia cocleata]|uniref:hypothetical protein n=1 Tax=Thomasclavelia cocleata TaxID=69824 RepID=UPI00257019F2|nr:hypothetical protein [Thomasclavelia cocleata]
MKKRLCVMILILCILFSFFKIYNRSIITFNDMREKSKQVDRNCFYHTYSNDLDTEEAFLVEFNEYNVNGYYTGFIDRTGKTSKPFKYTKKLYPYILKTFSGIYELSENEYINIKLEKITDKEWINKFKKEEKEYDLDGYIDITSTVEGQQIGDFVESKISGDIVKIEKYGEYYLVTFNKGFFGIETYNLFCDNQGRIISNMIFHAKDNVQIPKNKDEIGCFYYKELGKVYFDTDGNIIWITYNK